MTERPAYVVDASVVVRWHLKNDPFLTHSLAVLRDFSESRLSLYAPDNLLIEVIGAIRHVQSMRLITADRGTALMEQVLSLPMEEFVAVPLVTTETRPLIRPAYRLSNAYGCSFYDALYLVLAEQQHIPFIHADARLRRALAGRFPLELWIEDYPPMS